jgi:CheY-like chemotaxis protein
MNLLLVDDDALDRELFLDAIEEVGNGYLVSEANNGEEALQLMTDRPQLPDLIILDLNMPVKDGKMTLQELKMNPRFRRIPVCIMSTSSSDFDIGYAYDHGASMFLVKPLHFRELTEMVNSLLTLFKKYVTLAEARA